MHFPQRSGLTTLSLILSLAVIALIALLVIGYMSGKGGGGSAVDTPIKRAQNIECLAQVKKVEMQVRICTVQNGRYPESLEAVEGLSEPDLCCPVTRTYYQYDPQSGLVSCPDHPR